MDALANQDLEQLEHKKRKRKPRPKYKHQLPKGDQNFLCVDALNFSASFFDTENHANLKVW
jgi:hypothetical protein